MYETSKPYKKQILNVIEKTWNSQYLKITRGIYPIFERKFNYTEVDHTDGIGTKAAYHWREKTYKNAVLDALAMNLNDLALVKAYPYKLQNHIVLPEDNHEIILFIIETLAKECLKRKIVITGGETSVHNFSKSFDISMTVSGFIKHPQLNAIHDGDVLIGIKSGGLHSNGFTKVRKVFGNEFRKEFVEPTKIYLDEVLNICETYPVHGMMHLTGGAFTKLQDVSKDTDLIIDGLRKPQNIFYELYSRGISDKEMYRTFNCGVGFVLSVPSNVVENVIKNIDGSYVIGKAVKGTGNIDIHSTFSKQIIRIS
ncbi:hypothetical protein HYW58_00285 [Candidatus Kaiserbacteria bacterium]|nr:hypothetical protein [Candidatus Kaiserbacteria bacterium]